MARHFLPQRALVTCIDVINTQNTIVLGTNSGEIFLLEVNKSIAQFQVVFFCYTMDVFFIFVHFVATYDRTG